VLETGVVGTRVHEVRETELPDIAEPLQDRGVEQGEEGLPDLHVPMDRVLDDLRAHPEEQSSPATIKNTAP